MKGLFGIQIGASKFEPGLWYDSDAKVYDRKGFGFKIALVAGKMMRPVGRIYKRCYWQTNELNPWKTGNHWFVLKFPFVIEPFISLAIGPWGFYCGFKPVAPNDRYKSWNGPTEPYMNWFLCPSITFRSTRWR